MMAQAPSTTSSWFTTLKNAFRSSSSSSKKLAAPHNNVDSQKKRRWLFGKSQSHRHQREGNAITVAAAAATVATAEAAVVTVHAAIEIARLTSSTKFLKEVITLTAIVVIQTAFRGFMARKALRALKGLVKLQALVRGQNVRKQTKMTLQYIQALVRVQDQMRDQRARLSHEGGRRSSTLADSHSPCDYKLHQNGTGRRRTTFSGDVKWQLDNCEERSKTLDEIDKMLQNRKEVLMQREKDLAYAFSQQIQNSGRNISSRHESDVGVKWLNRWMAEKQWESGRASTDNYLMKTVEVVSCKPHLHMRSLNQQINNQRPASPQRVASPRRRTHDFSFNYQFPATPTTPRIRPLLQVCSASPRYFREEKSLSTTHTPKLSSVNRLNAELLDGEERANANDIPALPNYMAATESAKAKARSQSAPRIRPPTPDRERSGSVKKRLSYKPEEEAPGTTASRCGGMSQDLRSPSFKSFQDFSYGLEQQFSNLSSYYTDSLADEISPCSTTDLGRWLR